MAKMLTIALLLVTTTLTAAPQQSRYQLKNGDTLDLTFVYVPEFNQSVTIQPDGYLTLRGVGDVRASGLTLRELKKDIEARYTGILKEPDVSIEIKDFEKPFFLAQGEVQKPGKYDLRSDIKLSEAVAIAGGLSPSAKHSQVLLFRRGEGEDVQVKEIDLKKVLQGKDLARDIKQEADRYKQELQGIETQLASFGQEEQLVTDGTEKEIGVRKLSDYKAALVDTKTAIAETQARIRQLEKLSKTTAHRTVRSVRTAPNEALKDLQTQLVTLQVKRTEMEGKFAPTYRPLVDLNKQIEDVKKAIQEAQQSPMIEQTTDTNPADDWITVEMAKAHSELASLRAGTNAKERAVEEYRSLVLDLDQKNIRRSDLLRAQKTSEEKYLLYQRKQEEARIEQELDKQRILNVAIAEEPAVPVLPEPAPVPLKFGFVLAGLLSLGIGFVTDIYDRSFRTPIEVEQHLGIPVLASTPLVGDAPSQQETTAL
jgi:polysaccharide export outer membrane protein